MGALGTPFVKTFCGKNILTEVLTAPVIDGEPERVFTLSVAVWELEGSFGGLI